MRNQITIILAFVLLSSCTAKVTSNNAPGTFDGGDNRTLKISTDPLSGNIDSIPWKIGTALAQLNSNNEYSITIAGENVALTCNNNFILAPQISFVVPASKGVYFYDGSNSGYLVNVIVPYSTSSGGGTDNILASKSQISIEQITDNSIEGMVAALSPQGLSHSYDLSGKFKATVCGTISADPLIITQKNHIAFTVQYTEALRSKNAFGESIFEIRISDKVPKRKCNLDKSWMMDEFPIHYLTIQVPAQIGLFKVHRENVRYGYEYSSNHFSTDNFSGPAKVKSFSAQHIEAAMDVSDQNGYGIKAVGTLDAAICP